jgi:hypothetical protein
LPWVTKVQPLWPAHQLAGLAFSLAANSCFDRGGGITVDRHHGCSEMLGNQHFSLRASVYNIRLALGIQPANSTSGLPPSSFQLACTPHG